MSSSSSSSSSASLPSSAPSSTVSASSRAHRAQGYPPHLPLNAITPQTSSSPYWYDTHDPNKLWEYLEKTSVKQQQQVQSLVVTKDLAATLASLPTKQKDHLRVLNLSDTHNFHDLLPSFPAALDIDVLIHAGDFSNVGDSADVIKFTAWIRAFPCKYRIVIAGNHDVSFDEGEYKQTLAKRFQHQVVLDSKQLKKNLVEGYAHSPATADNPFPDFATDGGVAYLEDSGININGVKFWGSPWQVEFFNWGFNLPRGEKLREKWDMIPSDTDILITHGPPLGHGDMCLPHKNRAGCTDLLMQIMTRIKPRYHIFGHIHEGYGQTTDGTTNYINASNCNLKYDKNRLNPPIIFDIPIPHKQTATTIQEQQQSAASSVDKMEE